jgi:Uma2 family endonuclease
MSKNIANEPQGEYHASYTYADYLTFDFEDIVELIRGKIFRMSPAPRIIHQIISQNLSRIFGNYFLLENCVVFHAPTDVVLPLSNTNIEAANTVIQPDLCVVCDSYKIRELCVFGAPDLIIEILSPHTRKKDLQFKYDVYQEAGVREYWVVMPEEHLIEIFVLDNKIFKRIQTYTENDSVPSFIFPNLKVEMSEIFRMPN